MPVPQIETANVRELVELFLAVVLAQHDASQKFQTARYNRLFDQMVAIEAELRSREGDQRRALLPLLESRDVHVRLMTALALSRLFPALARKALENVRAFGQLPQSADAAMRLRLLDDGSYIPD